MPLASLSKYVDWRFVILSLLNLAAALTVTQAKVILIALMESKIGPLPWSWKDTLGKGSNALARRWKHYGRTVGQDDLWRAYRWLRFASALTELTLVLNFFSIFSAR